MDKIKMTTPLVEMDGDEMTRVLWQDDQRQAASSLCGPEDRILRPGPASTGMRPDDQVTVDAANATQKVRRGRQMRHHHPQRASAWTEYNLHEMWKSPNGTIRAILDGTVFRAPILVEGISPVRAQLEKAHHHRPSRLRRRI